MLDLKAIDPTTLQAGPDTDALVAEWMGWTDLTLYEPLGFPAHYEGRDLHGEWRHVPSYSTNPAHAGEARRKASYWGVKRWYGSDGREGVRADIDKVECFCAFDETNGDTGKAEALATCRAIVAAMQAEAAGGE